MNILLIKRYKYDLWNYYIEIFIIKFMKINIIAI
ncbi:hypothetical protein Ilyop_2102 (plasmid) [Ilyobacter polytropus DSM 2926]|uniref:Uncharacterized protein n=1 Tax=Ilyobacter polytropus (strain ATCC 51220 / DSM 2926 / LMG 16218 / CuHBu1) TaxID=572544 RepID=E3HBV6_ILYPC|nr:hypothetical protein Ilyop_2102 [Ilyobacter polytropus DSM 2926]